MKLGRSTTAMKSKGMKVNVTKIMINGHSVGKRNVPWFSLWKAGLGASQCFVILVLQTSRICTHNEHK